MRGTRLRYSRHLLRNGIVMRPVTALLLLVLTLFCLPLAAGPAEVPPPPAVPDGFSSSMVETAPATTPLHIIHGGRSNAPTLLLIHGLGQGVADWYPLLPQLARHYQVLAVDLPGFGKSPDSPDEITLQHYAALMHAIIKQRAATPLYIAGHSLGGAVALRYAHDHPENVERLLLLDAAGILHSSVFFRHLSQVRSKPSSIPLLGGLLAKGQRLANGISGSIQDRLASRGPAAAQAAGRYVEGKAGAEAALALGRENFNPLLYHFDIPLWMLWGAEDPVAPARTGRALHSLLPRSTLQLLPGIGHVPMSEATEATAAWMLGALTQPLPSVVPPSLQQHASGICRKDKTPHSFSNGSWSELVIDRCRKVSISNARIGKLRISNSNVELDNVTIDAEDVGLSAVDSNIVATGLRLNGKKAFRVQASRIDLAAAVLNSPAMGEVDGNSRLFLSLSQWCDGRERHGLHGVWEPARQTLQQAFPLDALGRCSLSGD